MKKNILIPIIAAIGLIALSSWYFQSGGNYTATTTTTTSGLTTTTETCNAGDVRKYDCPDGTQVNWCQCANQQMSCIVSPEVGCPLNKITIKNFAFNPNILIIKRGMTVTWTNEDSTPHQVASDPHPTHTDLPGLVSGVLSTGQSFSFTFTQNGTFGYHCHLHPSMKGTIVVQ